MRSSNMRKYLISFLLLITLVFQASLSFAAVAVSVTGTVAVINNTGSPTYTGITVAGGDTALLVVISYDRSAGTTWTSVLWGAQAMTLVPGTDSGTGAGRATIMYGVVNPTTGNQTLAIVTAGGGGENWYIDAISFTGTDVTNVATAFPNGTFTTGTSTTPSVTVTSASGDHTVATHCSTSGNFSAVNETQLYFSNAGASVNGAANRAAGAASVTLSATILSSTWTSAGTSVKAAAAGGGQTGTKSLMGFGK